LRNGEEGITKTGRKFKMANGKVRFVKGKFTQSGKRIGKIGNPPHAIQHHKTEARGMPGHHRLSSISDLVGVSMGALNRLAAGVSKCITVVTPQGVKSICNKMTGPKRKTAMSGARRKTRKRRTAKR
jgi:hypothetical protein